MALPFQKENKFMKPVSIYLTKNGSFTLVNPNYQSNQESKKTGNSQQIMPNQKFNEQREIINAFYRKVVFTSKHINQQNFLFLFHSLIKSYKLAKIFFNTSTYIEGTFNESTAEAYFIINKLYNLLFVHISMYKSSQVRIFSKGMKYYCLALKKLLRNKYNEYCTCINKAEKFTSSLISSNQQFVPFFDSVSLSNNGDVLNLIESEILKLDKLKKTYTLVLDLDETLIHFEITSTYGGVVHFRPYLKEFLTTMSKFYELVLFTAGIREYGDLVVDMIEKEIGAKVFSKRLFREDLKIIDSRVVKDLQCISDQMDKIILVDNLRENFYQERNGITIIDFLGDEDDRCLVELSNILQKVANSNSDIREEIFKYRKELNEKVSMCY